MAVLWKKENTADSTKNCGINAIFVLCNLDMQIHVNILQQEKHSLQN